MFKDSNTLLTTYMYSLRVQTKSSLRQCTRKPIPPPLLPRVVSDPSGNSAACKVDREKYLSILENLWASFLKSVLSRSFHIHHFHTAHHTPCKLPKYCRSIVFNFSWVLQSSQQKLRTILEQNFWGVNSTLWSLWKWWMKTDIYSCSNKTQLSLW